MPPATVSVPEPKKTDPVRKSLSRRQAIGLMFLCTLLGAGGQVLIKTGAALLGESTSPLAMISNPHLFAGYSLYGLMTALFVVALRDEELSIMYPIIALTYVWVAVLSVVVFHEAIAGTKIIGLVTICAGVVVLGSERKK